jgi:hypothetical protein
MSDLVKKTDSQLPAYMQAANDLSFGAENISSMDIKIPKIFLEQTNSPLVAEGKTRPGDIVESFEKRVLGGNTGPVVIVPFFMTQHWAFYWPKDSKMQGKLHHYEERYPGDKYEKMYTEMKLSDGIDSEDGKLQVYRATNIHCFVKGESLAIPYSLMLKKSSYGSAAVPFQTKAKQLSYEGKKIPMFNWNLTSRTEKNDQGQAYKVLALELAKDTKGNPIFSSEQEFAAACAANASIVNALKSGQKVDLTNEFEDAGTTTQSSGSSQF